MIKKVVLVLVAAILLTTMTSSLHIQPVRASATYTVITGAEADSTGFSSQRKLAATSDGSLHIVYHREDDSGILQIYHAESVDMGQTWSEEQVTDESRDQCFPSLAVDSNDGLHLVWQGGTHYEPDTIPYTYYREKDTSWHDTELVASYATTPSIAVDSNDDIHVVYGVYGYSPGLYGGGDGIRWRMRTQSGWQSEESISQNKSWVRYPAIAIDGNDYIHVVWKHAPGSDHDTHYRSRTSSGWGPEIEINTEQNNGHGIKPSIAIDSNNHVHVVWSYESGDYFSIKYRKFTTSWQPTVDLEVATSYSQVDPVISVDGEDHIHVVWSGQTAESPTYYQIRYREYTTSWQPVENLTSSSSDDQQYPNLMWASYPEVGGVKTNQPEESYAFVWTDGNTVKYHGVEGVSPPVADFTASPTEGPAPLTVEFTDGSTGDIDSWLWDFGDGGTSTDQNPSYTYDVPGNYTVSLTVSGPGGTDTTVKPDYVVVEEAVPDTSPPTVSSVSPEDGATGVAIGTIITATFSEAMDSSTITTSSFTLDGSAVPGTVTYDHNTYTATFTPDANLEYDHEYTANLSTDITDLAGNPLEEAFTWGFSTTVAIHGLQWPLEGTLSERTIMLHFGDDWVHGECPLGVVKKHAGIDIQATTDDDVYAAEGGEVKWKGTTQGHPEWGYGIVIEHLDFTTVYWHIDSLVNTGDEVIKGQRIGTVTDLGHDTHLHFGIRASSYSDVSIRGALPQAECGGDPAFPEYFVDPTLVNYIPVCDAGLNQSVSSGEVVHFDGSASYDPDGTITGYIWDFGDGETATGVSCSHRFRGDMGIGKEYIVELTVIDDEGATNTDTASIVVWPLDKILHTEYPSTLPGMDASIQAKFTYNWVDTRNGEDVYVLYRIHWSHTNFAGICNLFVGVEEEIPGGYTHKVAWWDGLLHYTNDKVYVPPISTSMPTVLSYLLYQDRWEPLPSISKSYGEDYFEGLEVYESYVMHMATYGTAPGVDIGTEPRLVLMKLFVGLLPIVAIKSDSACFGVQPAEINWSPRIDDIKVAGLCSPGELRVFDSEERVSGLVNGEIMEEIPNSAFFDGFVIISAPYDSYIYEVAGREEGQYGLAIASIEGEESTVFTATDIPTIPGAIHQYTIDWDILSQGEDGVIVQIDADGDGEFERTITADNELTADEFWPYSFEDSDRGTKLRINTDDQTFQFVAPDKEFSVKEASKMRIIDLSKGRVVRYNWFSRSWRVDTRGLDLDDELESQVNECRFKEKPKELIIIHHQDEELWLSAIAMDEDIDFCAARARDLETGKHYFLLDRRGVESNGATIEEPEADFTASRTGGKPPLFVRFTDKSTGEISSWQWDFGDGKTSTRQNPFHIYWRPGSYTVTLTVSGPGGSDTIVMNDYIKVKSFRHRR